MLPVPERVTATENSRPVRTLIASLKTTALASTPPTTSTRSRPQLLTKRARARRTADLTATEIATATADRKAVMTATAAAAAAATATATAIMMKMTCVGQMRTWISTSTMGRKLAIPREVKARKQPRSRKTPDGWQNVLWTRAKQFLLGAMMQISPMVGIPLERLNGVPVRARRTRGSHAWRGPSMRTPTLTRMTQRQQKTLNPTCACP